MEKKIIIALFILIPIVSFTQNVHVGPAYAGDTGCAWGGCEKDIINIIIQKREIIWYAISFVVFVFLFIKIQKLCKKKNISNNIIMPLFTTLYVITILFGGIFVENLDYTYVKYHGFIDNNEKYNETPVICIPEEGNC